MYVNRELEEILGHFSTSPEIVAILGARQVGKTTLLQNHFRNENSRMISFEDRKVLYMFLEDEKAFAEYYLSDCDILIIDEFQYAREGGRRLKYIYDSFPGKKIIISGSSSLELTEQATKYLVGRIFQFHLDTFNFTEFLAVKDARLRKTLLPFTKEISKQIVNDNPELPNLPQAIIEKTLSLVDEFVLFGGYPRVVLSENLLEKKTVLQNIFNTYLLKEIREILNIVDDFQMERLTKLLGLRIADLLKSNEVTNMIGINFKRLQQMLHILEKTYIIRMIPPFFTNNLLELTKSKKLFFRDTGFRNAVINNFSKLTDRSDSADLYENLIFSELNKKGLNLKYWRTKSKAEVDLIIEQSGQVIPVEIKTTIRRSKIQRSMLNFIKKYQPRSAFVVSLDFYHCIKIEATQVFFLPYAIFILMDFNEI
jgi:predicted AAA+ superfamily ATPase